MSALPRVLAGQQPPLDVEDVQVAPDEAIGRGRLGVGRRLALVVQLAFVRRELARGQALRLVLVDHRQQPVLQVDRLVVVGSPALAVV